MRPIIPLPKQLPPSLQLILPLLLRHLRTKLPLQKLLQLNIQMRLRRLKHHMLATKRTLILIISLQSNHTADAEDVVTAQTDGLVAYHGADGAEVVVELGD